MSSDIPAEILTAAAVLLKPFRQDIDESQIRDFIVGSETGKGSPEAEEKLISVKSAARRLSCSKATVWRLIKKGEIKSVSIGGMRRIAESEITRYIGEKNNGNE